MRRSMVALRGFQAPRLQSSTGATTSASPTADHTASSDPARRPAVSDAAPVPPPLSSSSRRSGGLAARLSTSGLSGHFSANQVHARVAAASARHESQPQPHDTPQPSPAASEALQRSTEQPKKRRKSGAKECELGSALVSNEDDGVPHLNGTKSRRQTTKRPRSESDRDEEAELPLSPRRRERSHSSTSDDNEESSDDGSTSFSLNTPALQPVLLASAAVSSRRGTTALSAHPPATATATVERVVFYPPPAALAHGLPMEESGVPSPGHKESVAQEAVSALSPPLLGCSTSSSPSSTSPSHALQRGTPGEQGEAGEGELAAWCDPARSAVTGHPVMEHDRSSTDFATSLAYCLAEAVTPSVDTTPPRTATVPTRTTTNDDGRAPSAASLSACASVTTTVIEPYAAAFSLSSSSGTLQERRAPMASPYGNESGEGGAEPSGWHPSGLQDTGSASHPLHLQVRDVYEAPSEAPHLPLNTAVEEEDDEALAREVAADRRLSEDLPFTPHHFTTYSPPTFSQPQPSPQDASGPTMEDFLLDRADRDTMGSTAEELRVAVTLLSQRAEADGVREEAKGQHSVTSTPPTVGAGTDMPLRFVSGVELLRHSPSHSFLPHLSSHAEGDATGSSSQVKRVGQDSQWMPSQPPPQTHQQQQQWLTASGTALHSPSDSPLTATAAAALCGAVIGETPATATTASGQTMGPLTNTARSGGAESVTRAEMGMPSFLAVSLASSLAPSAVSAKPRTVFRFSAQRPPTQTTPPPPPPSPSAVQPEPCTVVSTLPNVSPTRTDPAHVEVVGREVNAVEAVEDRLAPSSPAASPGASDPLPVVSRLSLNRVNEEDTTSNCVNEGEPPAPHSALTAVTPPASTSSPPPLTVPTVVATTASAPAEGCGSPLANRPRRTCFSFVSRPPPPCETDAVTPAAEDGNRSTSRQVTTEEGVTKCSRELLTTREPSTDVGKNRESASREDAEDALPLNAGANTILTDGAGGTVATPQQAAASPAPYPPLLPPPSPPLPPPPTAVPAASFTLSATTKSAMTTTAHAALLPSRCVEPRPPPPPSEPLPDSQEAYLMMLLEKTPSSTPAPFSEAYDPASKPHPNNEEMAAAATRSATDAHTFYDLPIAVKDFFAARRGVTKLYPWQHDVLTRDDVRRGDNFVYSLPTSGGKTLVAEISLLRCVLNRRRSCLFVLPFVSLAEEKTAALAPFGEAFDFAVDGHYGSTGRFPLVKGPAMYVCTIEKANSVLNHIIEEGRVEELGAVVVDELHMLGESRRGATLELFLSKLLLLSRSRSVPTTTTTTAAATNGNRSGHGEDQRTSIQIMGMSATVPNLPAIADWLGASYYLGDYRPVPLMQYSVVDGMVLRDGVHNDRNLSAHNEREHLFQLATEIPESSVLVFCASRQQCVDTARGIVRYLQLTAMRSAAAATATSPNDEARGKDASTGSFGFSSAASGGTGTRSDLETTVLASLPPRTAAAIQLLLADLYSLSHQEATQLAEVVPFGVAFHHGGLLAEERELIERAYRSRYIRILCCTSTLAAGVNLPARRVLLKSPYIGRELLTKSRYLQMCGRAGRAGLDDHGESFLLLSRRDRVRGHDLMQREMEKCTSQMLEDLGGFTRALLECVAAGLIRSSREAHAWGLRLLAHTAPGPVDAAAYTVLRQHLARHEKRRAGVVDALATATTSATNLWEQRLYAPPCGLSSSMGPHPSDVLSSTFENSNGSEANSHGWGPGEGLVLGAAGVSCGGVGEQKSVGTSPETMPTPAVIEVLLEYAMDTLVQCGLVQRTVQSKNRVTADEEASLTTPAPLIGADGGGVTHDSLFETNASHHAEEGEATHPQQQATAAAIGDHAPTDAQQVVEEKEAQDVRLEVTPFGASSVRSCFSVEEALLVRAELEQLRLTGLILADDLHLCYFLTPLREVGDCDWVLYRAVLSRLSDTRQRIAELLGVDEFFIDQRAMGLGGPPHAVPPTEDGKRKFFTARRFYVALMLADVLAEVPFSEVEERYSVNRGQLQSLMRSASMFSSSITSFCHAMEWYSLEAVLASFVKRLGFGVKPDLVPLMEIRGVQPGRARALWNAGYRDPTSIANALPEQMVAKVKESNPVDSKPAKFFTRRSALLLIREANLLLQSQIKEKKGELRELTARGSGGW